MTSVPQDTAKDTLYKLPKIQVMVVDDSAVIRGLFVRALESSPNITVQAIAENGEEALALLKENQKKVPIDVVVLDIEMPIMDGLSALPQFLEADPKVKVLMASTLTQKNASVSLEALALGAADYISKPSTSRELSTAEDFKRELIEKVQSLGKVVQKDRGVISQISQREAIQKNSTEQGGTKNYTLHTKTIIKRPAVIAIGSSTGGPQALLKVLSALKGKVNQPIFITQHMPETFTRILAQHIEKQTGLECAEAKDGDVVKNGKVHLAPGGYHMVIEERNNKIVTVLNQDAPENYCRPSIDKMLRSIINIYDARILSVILTGMGHDGRLACRELVEKGGMVLAQDEKTSVVWGMPGAVASENICFDVLPLEEIGPKIVEIASM